jgi:hypothetical protein
MTKGLLARVAHGILAILAAPAAMVVLLGGGMLALMGWARVLAAMRERRRRA